MKNLIINNGIEQNGRQNFFKIKLISKEKNKYKYKCDIDIDTPEFQKFKKKDLLINRYCSILIPKDKEWEKLFNDLYSDGNGDYFLINAYINFSFPHTIDKIISVKPIHLSIDDTIETKLKRVEEYSKNDWYRKADIEEINYLNEEYNFTYKEYERIKVESSKLVDINKLLKFNNKMLELNNKFKKLDIKLSSKLPDSMTFIQNHLYYRVHTNFKRLLDMQNIDEELIDDMKQLEYLKEQIGVTDIPKIYERWCLVVVINILIDRFHFYTTDENWKSNLVKGIIPDKNVKNIVTKLENKELECSIDVWYEKELKSGRRPDIVLEIKYKYLEEPYKVVLDAKFHEEANIKDLINDLYYTKDYAELNGKKDKFDGNKVFILHPDINALSRAMGNRLSIQQHKKDERPKWYTHSFYGEGALFTKEEYRDKYANHRYGAILVHPSDILINM